MYLTTLPLFVLLSECFKSTKYLLVKVCYSTTVDIHVSKPTKDKISEVNNRPMF